MPISILKILQTFSVNCTALLADGVRCELSTECDEILCDSYESVFFSESKTELNQHTPIPETNELCTVF